MVTSAIHCQVSVCVSQEWWASSVTNVPLDSDSPIAQVTTLGTTILMNGNSNTMSPGFFQSSAISYYFLMLVFIKVKHF